MFVSDSEDHILEKILKTVEGSAGIEERTLFLKKIEQGDLHISLSGKKVYRNGKEILLNRHEFDMGLKKGSSEDGIHKATEASVYKGYKQD